MRLRSRPAAATGLLAVVALAGCSVQLAGKSQPNTTGPTAITTGTPLANYSGPTPGPVTDPTSLSGAFALQNAYQSVVKQVLPSVVQIETDQGLGSGIVFDGRGNIVTNNHVIAGGANITVTTASGAKYPATVVGTYPADDLAVVHVNAALPPATFGDSRTLQVGAIVMAVGNPLGLQSSVTAGIVSATGRTVSEGSGITLPDTIQTSAEINPGNSGGALVDLNAHVVGIPTLAASDPQLGGAAAGIGFAIPSSIIKDIAAQLVAAGHVTNSHRAFMGVRIAAFSQANGALISSVVAGGPADKAGLQAGDLVTAADGKPVASADALTSAIAAHQPGDKMSISVQRQDGSQKTLTITLGELPA